MSKTLSEEKIYKGRVVNLKVAEVLLDNGLQTKMEVINHSGASIIIAEKENGKILVERQPRYAVDEYLLELPAGKLDYITETEREDPLICAKRELEEETGYIADHWEKFGFIYTTPGFCDEKIYVFYAKNLTKTRTHFDDDEEIELFEYSYDELKDLIKTGKIVDSKTIAALYMKETRND